MKEGYTVVYRVGNDKTLYRIYKMNRDDTCDILSITSSVPRTVSLSQLREADDTEMLIGYRM